MSNEEVNVFRTITIDTTGHAASVEGTNWSGKYPENGLLWIDLCNQDGNSLQELTERFRFHPLTVEDCLHFDQRPKLESYDGYMFLVLQGFQVNWDDLWESQALELHIFVGPNYIVTVHEQSIPSIDTLWNRVLHDGKISGNRPDQLCYLLADSLIDSYFPIIDELHVRLDDLEDRVLSPSVKVSLEDILSFKRLLIDLRRVLSPQRDVLALLAKRGDSLISDRVAIYFRDVYDHAIRLHESVESARELIGNVRDAHLWNASQRTNEIMKRLTILSAIFLPLTFITGFFGQNFEDLPFASKQLMYLMIFACIATPVGMLIYFARNKWFSSEVP
jgi:magnesium transporter